MGFSAVKFHTYCIPKKDLELAEAARKAFPSMSFMIDAENNYDLESSLIVAKKLEKLEFTWFEAPLPDYDFAGYKKIKGFTNWKPKYSGKKGFYKALEITINWFKNPKNLKLYKSDVYNV